jgi:hypothetical protein
MDYWERRCPGCGGSIRPDELVWPATRTEHPTRPGAEAPADDGAAAAGGAPVAVHPDCFPPRDGFWTKHGSRPIPAREVPG